MADRLHGVVVAPAGYGKTHRITQMLTRSGRSLVLTHTNVAVGNIKRRTSSRVDHRIETIDSFARRLALSFRTISKVGEASTDWGAIRSGAESVLSRPALQSAIRASYDQVLVDEFQDCSAAQTALVHRLASLLPTAVFGDPMQSLYDKWGGDQPVSWEEKVAPWDSAEELTQPWRWQSAPEQAAWIVAAMDALETGDPVRLDQSRNVLRAAEQQYGAYLSKVLAAKRGSCAIIHGDSGNPNIASAIAKAHRYSNVELAERSFPPELEQFVSTWHAGSKAAALLSVTKACFSRTDKVSGFTSCLSNARTGNPLRGRTELARALAELDSEAVGTAGLAVLEVLSKSPETYAYRPDLVNRIRRALRLVQEDPRLPMRDAIQRVQDQIRAGAVRSPTGPVVGNVLRLKGLEFDHVVIVRSDKFADIREVYVAISRAKHSVTVIPDPGETLRWFRI